jgi:hypothetical protein
MKDLSYKPKGCNVRQQPLNYYEMSDGTSVAIYQGSRGDNHELDFIVKYKDPNSKTNRLRTPKHTHWIFDLLRKSDRNKVMVRQYVQSMLDSYEKLEPFRSVEQRNNYQLTLVDEMSRQYKELNGVGEYNMDTMTCLLELFTRCEKQTKGAFMFKQVLLLVRDYCDGKKDSYQVISHSSRV